MTLIAQLSDPHIREPGRIAYGRVDTIREEWLTDERFTAVEVMLSPDASAIIATRR